MGYVGDIGDFDAISDPSLQHPRGVSWGQDVFTKEIGDETVENDVGEVGPIGQWGHGEGEGEDGVGWDSATSGLGFMSALQRALCRQKGDKTEREQDQDCDRHALELLSTIAACCEVGVALMSLSVFAVACVHVFGPPLGVQYTHYNYIQNSPSSMQPPL